MSRRITTREELERHITLTPEERGFFHETGDDHRAGRRLPPAIPRSFLELMGDDPEDPIRRQVVPSAREFHALDYERSDPLGESSFMPVPRLIHRYPDRALLLATDSCAVHCRHCFRRRFAGSGSGVVRPDELSRVTDYLGAHEEIREVLLSGGDPLTLENERFAALLGAIRGVREELVVRIATRVPGVTPERIDTALIDILREHTPIWLVVQVNHPRELTAGVEQALKALASSGIPVLSQTVLLRGVNDSVEALESLFTRLVSMLVKPYYLFQGDLAPGTSQFRVPIEEGLDLVRRLRRRVSGLAMPTYAVDLPGGGGKVPLTESYLKRREGGWYVFESPSGDEYRYPDEAPCHGTSARGEINSELFASTLERSSLS